MNPRRRNPSLSAFTVKPSRFGPVYVLNVPATSGGVQGSADRAEWERGQAHYFILSPFAGVYSIAGGLGKHARGTYSTILGRGTYADPVDAAAALDAYIPKGAGNFIHRSNPARAKRNPRPVNAGVEKQFHASGYEPARNGREWFIVDSYSGVEPYFTKGMKGGTFSTKQAAQAFIASDLFAKKLRQHAGFTTSRPAKGDAPRVRLTDGTVVTMPSLRTAGDVAAVESLAWDADAGMYAARLPYHDDAVRQRLRNPRRNPADPLAYGRGPIPPRVAQAAAAILGWAETERIVGPGLLSGASGYDLRRLVYAAKVERERQGGPPAIRRR